MYPNTLSSEILFPRTQLCTKFKYTKPLRLVDRLKPQREALLQACVYGGREGKKLTGCTMSDRHQQDGHRPSEEVRGPSHGVHAF